MSGEIIKVLHKQDMPHIFNIAMHLLSVLYEVPPYRPGALTSGSWYSRQTFNKPYINHRQCGASSESIC